MWENFLVRGFDTFGTIQTYWRHIKGHPDKNDLDNAKTFFPKSWKGESDLKYYHVYCIHLCTKNQRLFPTESLQRFV